MLKPGRVFAIIVGIQQKQYLEAPLGLCLLQDASGAVNCWVGGAAHPPTAGGAPALLPPASRHHPVGMLWLLWKRGDPERWSVMTLQLPSTGVGKRLLWPEKHRKGQNEGEDERCRDAVPLLGRPLRSQVRNSRKSKRDPSAGRCKSYR